MKRTDAVAMGLMFLVGACAPAAATHDLAADKAALDKVRDAYATAFKAGNAAGLAALYASDAVEMNSEVPTATGTAAIEAANKAFMDQMSAQSIVISATTVEVSGDVAIDIGTYKISVTPKGAPAAMTDSGRYLVVSKRQADGSWKLAAAMGNRFSPATPMPAAAPPKKK